MKYILIAAILIFIGCKKDDGPREIVLTWDKPVIYNDLDAGNIGNSDCLEYGTTVHRDKGKHLHITLYNCSSPKTDSHVTITVKGSRPKKDKVIYESTNKYHEIDLVIP